MLVTGSQLASYDQIKEMILGKGVMRDGLGTHMTASFTPGFVAVVASNPINVIKTQVMNMKVEPRAKPPYSDALDCALKMKTVLCTFFFLILFMLLQKKKKKTYSKIWSNNNNQVQDFTKLIN